MAAQDGIEHVVVLMLENRSFDSMFGNLYPKSAGLEGLSGNETNPYHLSNGSIQAIKVWNDPGMDAATATIPDPDPGELFREDMDEQLFGRGGTPNEQPPPMNGFVDNYMSQTSTDPAPVAANIMHYFTERQVPVLSALAKAFGVSDQWHASAPCQTWPNRFFVHTGTAGGYTDNHADELPFDKPSIFKRFGDKGRTWRVYYHDMPQALTLGDILLDVPFHFRKFDEHFAQDARTGNLPNYSFIEPAYFANSDLGLIPSDEHPPHNVLYGERLIARVYNAVRGAPTWKKTLLVITFDEHGGCYDHVPPPLAVSPDNSTGPDGFAFDRYGVRVPAVIVSPYMPRGEIVRSAETGLPHQGPPYPFDHTSILATLRKLFDLGDPLTKRDAVAPDLLGPLSLADPTNDGPASVTAPAAVPSAAEVSKLESRAPNHMQQSLCELATRLLPSPIAAAAGTVPAVTPPLGDVKTAASYAVNRTRSLLKPQ
jgi:phospholipase C